MSLNQGRSSNVLSVHGFVLDCGDVECPWPFVRFIRCGVENSQDHCRVAQSCTQRPDLVTVNTINVEVRPCKFKIRCSNL